MAASTPGTASPLAGRAAVMGCGGVLGIAWATGLVAGLARRGVEVRDADLIVGASAGAVVAAQLAGTADLEELLAAQLDTEAASNEQLRPYSQAAVDAANSSLFDKVHGDLRKARQRIGVFALRSETPPPAERRRIVAARLPSAEWPTRPLKIVAVNAHTGDERVMDAHSGVELVDAVTASCAVPGVWPVVVIGGEPCIDGGIRSMTNADLAAGARRVLVITPQGYSRGNPVSGHLDAELAALALQGTAVLVIEPDHAAIVAMGPNILDPARRADVARAGLAQAHLLAQSVALFWNVDAVRADAQATCTDPQLTPQQSTPQQPT